MTTSQPHYSAPKQSVDHAEPDLFDWAGVPIANFIVNDAALNWTAVPGSSLMVWRNVEGRLEPVSGAVQLVLNFPFDGAARLIPRRLSAFMNADIRTVLVDNFRDRAAAAHLAHLGIFYLGDVSLMSPFELIARLGSHAAAFDSIVKALASVGLALQAQAPWWTRPADYYERAR